MPLNHSLKSAPTDSQIDYASELNAEQLTAVTAPPGPLLVIAGAGSGKTRALTYRVAWLMEQHVQPENILLLTFTNKAAKEMLERVSRLLPYTNTTRLWGGTFHHVGNRFLRHHMNLLGRERDFTIHDREDSIALLKSCMEDAGIDSKKNKFPKPDVIIEIISLGTNTKKSAAEILRAPQFRHLNEFAEKILSLEKAYQQKKIDANAVDYDDLLTLPIKILRENPETLDQYQTQFQHILVDEYQDTNLIQAELVDLLAAKHHHLMVVGDDAQSIYSWRGAHFENIITFKDRYPGTKTIRLETNYRSVPEILALANMSIAQNEVRIPKNLRAVRPGGIKPALVSIYDGHQQADFIAKRALELMDEGVEAHEIAVLYRSHFHSMELQMELTRRKIPFQITSGLRFFEQAHVKDVAAYLRFLVNPRDVVAFKRVLLLMPGIGLKTALKIAGQIAGGSMWEHVKVSEKAIDAWKKWGEFNQKLRESDASPALLIRHIIDELYEDYLKATYANYLSRTEDLEQLESFADEFDNSEEFLSQLSLLTNVEADDAHLRPNEGIRLTSIHQAKGLEFKVVFLIMLCEGMFPSSRAMETKEGEEEERRLFYVAVTRAKDELYLTYPKIRNVSGHENLYQSPSRFLEDFPQRLCNVWHIAVSPSTHHFSSRKHKNAEDYWD